MKNNKIGKAPAVSWIVFAMVWLVYAFNTGCREILNKLMPAIVEHFHMSASLSGLLGTAGTVGAGIFVLFISDWGDRQGLGYKRSRPQFIVACLYLAMTFLIGLPVMNSMTILFVLQFFRFGFAQGGEGLDASAAAEWFPQESKNFIICAHHTGYPWGSAIVCLFAVFLYNRTGSWKLPFMVIPIVALVLWIIYIFYASRSRVEQNNKNMEAMGLHPSITMDEIELQASEKSEDMPKQKKESMFSLFRNRNVIAAFIAYAFIIGAYYGFNYWLTPYLTYQCNMDTTRAAAFSVVFTITAGLGQIFWGAISEKIGSKRTMIICSLWLLVCFSLLPLMKKGILVLIIIQLMMGFCLNATFPVLYSIAGASVRKDQLATAIGICNFAGIIGGVYPLFMGNLISLGGGFHSAAGYTYCLIAMVASLAISLAVMVLLCHEVSGPRKEKA